MFMDQRGTLSAGLALEETPLAPAGITLHQPQPCIRHFAVSFFNRDGQALGEHTFSFDCGAQDTYDAVLFSRHAGRLRLGLVEQPAAAALARQQLPVLRDKEDLTAHLSLPRALTGENICLGGPYLPSAGSSTEMSTLVPVEVTESMQRCAGLTFVDVEDILQNYLRGIPGDTKVVLAALRLSDFLQQGLNIGLDLTRASRRSEGEYCGHITRADAALLRSRLLAPPESEDAAYTLQCVESPSPTSCFLASCSFENDSEQSIVLRKGYDAVDVAAYTWEQDTLCLVIKRGLRPVLAARTLLKGQRPAPVEALAYEGIAESLEGEQSLEAIGKRAAEGVREEAGIEPCAEPCYVGSSFPSPGVHAERVFNFLVEADPRTAVQAQHTLDERVDVFVVPVQEIIALCNDGTIKDPRLEINARLLARSRPPSVLD